MCLQSLQGHQIVPNGPLGMKAGDSPELSASIEAHPGSIEDALYGSKKEASYIEERLNSARHCWDEGADDGTPASGDCVMRRS
jgi:hypothetical protein